MSNSVYRIYDAAGRLLYIGCSTRPIIRIFEHSHKEWALEIARVDVEHYPGLEMAALAEIEAIASERPLYNKALQEHPSLRQVDVATRAMVLIELHAKKLGLDVDTVSEEIGFGHGYIRRFNSGETALIPYGYARARDWLKKNGYQRPITSWWRHGIERKSAKHAKGNK